MAVMVLLSAFMAESKSVITGSLALIAVLLLVALLVQKELASVKSNSRYQSLGQVLNIAIVPLLIAFVLIVVIRLAEYLNLFQ